MKTIETLRLTAAVTVAFGLAGCGGGSSSVGAASGASPSASSSTSASNSTAGTVQIDLEGLDALGGEFTEKDRYFKMWNPATAASIPITGSATYNGIAAFGKNAALGEIDAGNPDMLADMALTVNFGTAKVTGSMWNFHDDAGKVGAGSIALRGNQDANKVSATGTSTIHWGNANDILTVDMDGYFLTNTYGIKGNLTTTTLGAGGEVESTGIVILKSDAAP